MGRIRAVLPDGKGREREEGTMNIFALLLLFVVAVAALFGLAYAGSHMQTAPVADSYGNYTSSSVNASQAVVGNLTAQGQQVGGGVIILITLVIAAVVFIGFLLIVASRKRY
jgi:hypothetical protein